MVICMKILKRKYKFYDVYLSENTIQEPTPSSQAKNGEVRTYNLKIQRKNIFRYFAGTTKPSTHTKWNFFYAQKLRNRE